MVCPSEALQSSGFILASVVVDSEKKIEVTFSLKKSGVFLWSSSGAAQS
jgi:hypothetical protein